MLKVLLLPLIYGAEKCVGVINAFKQLGHNVEVFDYYSHYENNRHNQKSTRQTLITTAKRFMPDIIYCQIQHTVVIDAETLRSIRNFCPNVKIVNYTIDVRATIQRPYFDVSKISDMNLICSTGQLEMYQNNGVPNVHFLHVGYSPELYKTEIQPKESYEFDTVFVANVNAVENYPGHKERMDAAYALKDTFGDRFGLFGCGWPNNLKPRESVGIDRAVIDVYSRSFSAISISHFNEIDHYFSDRLLMCLASGRPTVSWHFPKYESYFVNNCDLLIAKGPEDIVNKVRYLLENKERANYIGMNGGAKVFAEHTYLSRIREMLDLIGLS